MTDPQIITESTVRQFGGRVRYFKQENWGAGADPTSGINRSRSDEYNAFLEKLARQIPVLDADPEVGMVYCDWAACPARRYFGVLIKTP